MESAEDELIAETEKVISSLLELPTLKQKSSKRKQQGRNSSELQARRNRLQIKDTLWNQLL